MRHSDAEFEEALERSSLGTAGAQTLRRQTPPAEVDRVRRLARLRHTVVSGDGDGSTCTELIRLYSELGYEADLIPVWQFLNANIERFPYLQDVADNLPEDLVVRLLGVTEVAACERLLGGMDDARLAAMLLGVQRKHALEIVRNASKENAARILKAAVVLPDGPQNRAAWLAAAEPTLAARVLLNVYGTHEEVVGDLMRYLNLAHVCAILEATGDPKRSLEYLKCMDRLRTVAQMPYSLCLDLLFVSYPREVSPREYWSIRPTWDIMVTEALARVVAKGINKMSVTEASAELRRISGTSANIAGYVQDIMTVVLREGRR
ncbi:hypothetical protein [Krasilnikovia sp. M28-CT-15]|uniref:hypothetical protein n=1 Tax=Krasilnikovia sp. M28-CT-15 TaxID=3373540 RepID=UPI003876DBBB